MKRLYQTIPVVLALVIFGALSTNKVALAYDNAGCDGDGDGVSNCDRGQVCARSLRAYYCKDLSYNCGKACDPGFVCIHRDDLLFGIIDLEDICVEGKRIGYTECPSTCAGTQWCVSDGNWGLKCEYGDRVYHNSKCDGNGDGKSDCIGTGTTTCTQSGTNTWMCLSSSGPDAPGGIRCNPSASTCPTTAPYCSKCNTDGGVTTCYCTDKDGNIIPNVRWNQRQATSSGAQKLFGPVGKFFAFASGKQLSEGAKLLYKAVLPMAVIIGMVLVAVAGWKLMTSQGDPQQTQEGKEQLTSAIMGLLFVLLGAGILRAIISTLIKGTDPGF